MCVRIISLLGPRGHHHEVQIPDMDMHDLVLALLGFSIVWFWSFFVMPSLITFRIRNFILCKCVNCYLKGNHSKWIALNLRNVFGLWTVLWLLRLWKTLKLEWLILHSLWDSQLYFQIIQLKLHLEKSHFYCISSI